MFCHLHAWHASCWVYGGRPGLKRCTNSHSVAFVVGFKIFPMHLLSACSVLPCQTVWLKNWSPRLRLHCMSLLIKRCYAELIWAGKKRFEITRLARFSTKVQENHTLVFHWCSQERLHCPVVRRMEFDSIESMRRALELSAVLPGHSYDEAFVPWQMFAFGIFVFASLESLDLVICALLSLPLSRKGFLLGFTFHDACVQAVYKELGYDDQKLVALELVPEEWNYIMEKHTWKMRGIERSVSPLLPFHPSFLQTFVAGWLCFVVLRFCLPVLKLSEFLHNYLQVHSSIA